MIDYRLHYAQMLAEDRLREAELNRGHRAAIRIFRLAQKRPAGRKAGR
jgi:hypothetical protein